jgi:signal transduction histidine kinase
MKVLEFDRLDAFLELEIDGKEIKEVSEIPLINAIPLDKVKKAREDILKKAYEYSGSGNEVTQAYCDGFKNSLEILDKLIAESEG